MKYVGGKSKLAKCILPIILKDRLQNQYYVEPFMGGANVIDKVTGNRIGADINTKVIDLFKALQADWIPPKKLTEDEYYEIKKFPDKFPKEIVAFAAICCSFAGKEWGGYARGAGRNYALEQYKALTRQKQMIQGIQFINCSYQNLELPDKSLIYCDPPYKDTQTYSKHRMNYDLFYQWCRDKKEDGHTIYVSEYNMPEDFICIWAKERAASLDLNTGGKKSIEKLYKL